MNPTDNTWQPCNEDRIVGWILLGVSTIMLVLALLVHFQILQFLGVLGLPERDVRDVGREIGYGLLFQLAMSALNVAVGLGIMVSSKPVFVVGLVLNVLLLGAYIATVMDVEGFGTFLAVLSAMYCAMRLAGKVGTPVT